ncbi:ACT domain-containing protein [Arthrobacter sp. APC 3897]|uniref:ACT domain-containing protein n=1 Tax=Arthrobacter sp. APC 3897 TaxID=3035204 RepID=UPI0025B3C75F|nr:ACT domain-containing protein [Arthrobacter sp. APC 3897]MDN3482006.1 ACT domain-containing protein [Arthrobacter sp. APC 3897]
MTMNAIPPAVSLTLLPDHLSIYRFDPVTPLSEIGQPSGVWSITRTQRELSVVAEENSCLAADDVDPGWRCLYVDGPIPFDLAGVVAGLTAAVAQQGLPVFVLSTFDSDLLLLRGKYLDQSLRALRDKGYLISGAAPLL